MDIRDKIITGTFAIGQDGRKEPIDWKDYALKLEPLALESKGMKWKKASERLPDKGVGLLKYVWVRSLQSKCGSMMPLDIYLKLDGIENTEWLDESINSPKEEPDVQERAKEWQLVEVKNDSDLPKDDNARFCFVSPKGLNMWSIDIHKRGAMKYLCPHHDIKYFAYLAGASSLAKENEELKAEVAELRRRLKKQDRELDKDDSTAGDRCGL
jgi:hypothetical protein